MGTLQEVCYWPVPAIIVAVKLVNAAFATKHSLYEGLPLMEIMKFEF